jgi:PAS domain S-box-containing protein
MVQPPSIFTSQQTGNTLLNSTILSSVPVAIYTCDKDGYITWFNAAAAALWGREPVIGSDLWSGSLKMFYADGIRPMPMDSCPMAICLKEERAIQHEEIVIERPDGLRKSVQANPKPIFSEEGKLIGAVNTLVEIVANKKLEEQDARLAAIILSSEDAIISKTLDGIVTSWNPRAVTMFGYTEEEMIGRPITLLIPPDRMEEEPTILEKLKKGERLEHFETKRITKNGTVLDISLMISPIRDRRGKIIGASKIARDITKQKMLSNALIESEERLRLAIESTNLGTWEYLPQLDLLTWSDACRKIYEVPSEMPVDFNFFKAHIFEDDKEMAEAALQRALDPLDNGSFNLQFRIIRYRSGQPLWVNAHGKVYFLNGLADRFIGTVLDINKEKIEEQELKNSVELFQTMADNVPAMIWMSGSDKFKDYFNKAWLAFRGRTREEEENDAWIQGVHPEDITNFSETYHQALTQQKGFRMEYRLLRHDRIYRWISDSCVPRHSPNGEFLGFISACMDIDDQKRFREKLLDNEMLFKTISNASPVGLWMTDTTGFNTFVNDTWIKWTGIPSDQQRGEGWLEKVVAEDRIDVSETFAQAMKRREKYSVEFRIVRADGQVRWCLTEGSPYYDINGDFRGYAGSVTDISDLKQLEERKDDFIKMASHELKTPITSIKGYVQLLMNIYDEGNEEKLQLAKPVVRSSLGTISKQISKLTRLVSELLDLSRIETGKLELNRTMFDPVMLVEETVQDVRQTTTSHAIIVHSDFEGNVFADRDRISQVLLNLLTNAIKYSPDAHHIDVYINRDVKGVAISVADHGIGIEKKDHVKIFERFYRVEGRSEQTYPGFGIGLFIASEIIHRHNGTIAVKSEKGRGSVFTFTLPVLSNPASAIELKPLT